MTRPPHLSLASVPHVLGRARREGPAAVLTCLEDLRLWSAATTREQTLAAEAVADLIGGPFRLLGTQLPRGQVRFLGLQPRPKLLAPHDLGLEVCPCLDAPTAALHPAAWLGSWPFCPCGHSGRMVHLRG